MHFGSSNHANVLTLSNTPTFTDPLFLDEMEYFCHMKAVILTGGLDTRLAEELR
jgi:hypothetical protein